MRLDILLQIFSAVLTVILAYVGIEMANTPPISRGDKWKYRVSFIVLGLLLVSINYWQFSRNAKEQADEKSAAIQEQQRVEAQYNQVQGRLNTIGQFMEHPPTNFNSSQVAAAIREMANISQSPSKPPVQLPPYGNLGAQADELGKELIEYAQERLRGQPDLATQKENYDTWFGQNDGVGGFYQRGFDRWIIEIHDRLRALQFSDDNLDQLIEDYKRDYSMRQKFTAQAIQFPEGFHLSIEDIRKMGELFQSLAKQIHY